MRKPLWFDKLIKKASEERGDSTILFGAIVALCVFIIAMAVLEVIMISVIVKHVDEDVERSIVACAEANSKNAYGGVREGNSSLYDNGGGARYFAAQVTDDEVVTKMNEFYDFVVEGDISVKYRGGDRAFGISNLTVDVTNPDYNAENGDSAVFVVNYDLTLYINALGTEIATPPISRQTVATWTALF